MIGNFNFNNSVSNPLRVILKIIKIDFLEIFIIEFNRIYLILLIFYFQKYLQNFLQESLNLLKRNQYFHY